MPHQSPCAETADHRLAHDLAFSTGELLLELRRAWRDASQAERKAAGDQRAHRFILDRLVAQRPNDPIRSEESSAAENHQLSPAERGAGREWIIDPLDGTREFAELDRNDWAVHVALCIDGHPVVGAVALPAQGRVLSTLDPPSTPLLPTAATVVVSRISSPCESGYVADVLDAQRLPMGSAGANTMAVVDVLATCYPHSGGQYEWDSAAPVAVALAAGLRCSRLDGSPLQYQRLNPYLPDLLVCHPEVCDLVLGTLA